MDPMKFIFGGTVYEIKIEAFLKDVTAEGMVPMSPPEKQENYQGGCMLEFRPNRDDKQFLMGNSFLKNFVSVYDYDQ
jgi:hypothetical protein